MKSSRAPSRAGSAGRRPAQGAASRRPPAASATGVATLLFEGFDRGAFAPTLYLEGPSEPLKAALLAELRAGWSRAHPDSPPRVFHAAESPVEEILAAIQSGSLFSTHGLAIVLEVEKLRTEKRIAALAAGLAHPAAGSSLVLVESATESERKTLAPLKHACSARWNAEPPHAGEMVTWGARRLARAGVSAEPGVIEAVAEACDGDALAFFNECDRLVAFGAGGHVTRADAELLLRPVIGAEIKDYLGAVALGYPRLAAQRLGALIAEGVGEGQIFFALANLVGGALGGWKKWPVQSAELRHRLSSRELARGMDAVYRAESAWKGGRADPIAALEQATRVLSAPQ
jgi:DNA polymerase III delta subunit